MPRSSSSRSSDTGSPDRARSREQRLVKISVVAARVNMHPQTMRVYESKGLINPSRSPKGTRLYCEDDIRLLQRIQELTIDLGINLAGVQRILALEAEVQHLRQRLAAHENRSDS